MSLQVVDNKTIRDIYRQLTEYYGLSSTESVKKLLSDVYSRLDGLESADSSTKSKLRAKIERLDGMYDDITELQAENEKLKSSLKKLQGKHQKLEASVVDLQDSNQNYNTIIEELQNSNQLLKDNMEELQDNSDSQNAIKELQNVVKELQNKNQQLNNMVRALQNKLDELQKSLTKNE